MAVTKPPREIAQQTRKAFLGAIAPPAACAGSSGGAGPEPLPLSGARAGSPEPASPLRAAPFLLCPFSPTGHNSPRFYSFLDNTSPRFCSSHSVVSPPLSIPFIHFGTLSPSSCPSCPLHHPTRLLEVGETTGYKHIVPLVLSCTLYFSRPQKGQNSPFRETLLTSLGN